MRTEDCKAVDGVDIEFCMKDTSQGKHGSGIQHFRNICS